MWLLCPLGTATTALLLSFLDVPWWLTINEFTPIGEGRHQLVVQAVCLVTKGGAPNEKQDGDTDPRESYPKGNALSLVAIEHRDASDDADDKDKDC